MLDKTFAFVEYMSTAEFSQLPRDGLAQRFYQDARNEIQLMRSLPEVVMLAGSARFRQAFEDEAYRLAIDGKIVLGKHVFKPGADWPLNEHDKDLIHAVQFRMVELASRVHVVNVDGYVGRDTYNLIRFALKLDRVLTFLEDRVQLESTGEHVTTHHFLQATRRRVEFEMAAYD